VAIPANADAATIQNALGSLAGIGRNVQVTRLVSGQFLMSAANGITLPGLSVTGTGAGLTGTGPLTLTLATSGPTTISDGTDSISLHADSTATDIAAALGNLGKIGVRATVTGTNGHFTIAPQGTLTTLPTLQVGEDAGGMFGPTPAGVSPAGDRLTLPVPAFVLSDGTNSVAIPFIKDVTAQALAIQTALESF